LSNTEDKGPSNGNETDKTIPQAETEQQEAKAAAVTYGFNDGAFVLRIPGELGYHAIQGHIQEASAWLRMMQAKAQMEAKKETDKGLIKPGFRGFNLFK